MDGWFEILRDDSQSPERWAEAVRNTIAMPWDPFVDHAEESAARRKAMHENTTPA